MQELSGRFDAALVVLSILIATAASYTALDLGGRIRASHGWAKSVWFIAAAIVMGGGIWSMHFVGMLAFSIDGVPISYNLGLTFLSLMLPIVVTGAGFYLVSAKGADRPLTLAASGLFMGSGIVAMHYTGMAAMSMPAHLHYNPNYVLASVLIAIGASTVALWIAFRETGWVQKIIAAGAMGGAISGMHYTAMAAAHFGAAHAGTSRAPADIEPVGLALAVATITFLIFVCALVAAMFDRRVALFAGREAIALRESEERMRTLYRRTPLPLHSLNKAGEIENVSDAWLELMGYSREEVLKRPLAAFISEEVEQLRFAADWATLLEQGEVKEVEYRFVSKSGERLDGVLSSKVERNQNGETVVLGGLLDVTARKRAEEALRHAQKMEAVGQLTGGVAHDFNNLLAAVLGNLELLKRRLPGEPKITRLIDNALQGAQRGIALTKRMLSFARRQELKPEAVDVGSLVRGMAPLLQQSTGPMVKIETSFAPNLPPALVDANYLELALVNLVLNARDASPSGGSVTITGREAIVGAKDAEELTPGSYICISVIDSGTGMDEATLARATEPFFTTKGVGKGTGLGLSIVHGLAAQSGGRLVLTSKPGEGTTAEIWLPRTAEASVASATRSRTGNGADLPSVTPLSVLVVDDDELVLEGTAAMLEELGHATLKAPSAAAGLDLLRMALPVDLIVTDQAMPEMTGTQLAAIVSAEWPSIPVILATGYAETVKDSPLPKLHKPFQLEELAGIIAGTCTAAKLARARVV
jgi:PAS domain S-box-containing protein